MLRTSSYRLTSWYSLWGYKRRSPFCHFIVGRKKNKKNDQPIFFLSLWTVWNFVFRSVNCYLKNVCLEVYLNTKLTLLDPKFTSYLWEVQAGNIINHREEAWEILSNQITIVESDPQAVQVFKDILEGHALAVSGELLYVLQFQPLMVDAMRDIRMPPRSVIFFSWNGTWYVHYKSRVLIQECPTTRCTINVPADFFLLRGLC